MNIFGNEIETVDFAESKFYNLNQICQALDMEPGAVVAFMRQHVGYNIVQTKNAAWIDYPTLLRWMMVPAYDKILSPAAIEFATGLVNDIIRKSVY